MQTQSHDGPPIYEFGWRPEIFGTVMMVSITTFLMTMARGSL